MCLDTFRAVGLRLRFFVGAFGAAFLAAGFAGFFAGSAFVVFVDTVASSLFIGQ
jgi:hypothetical protein